MLCGCRSAARRDEPDAVVPVGVVLRDVTFRSAALGREVAYRVVAPAIFKTGEPIRVVYLLHGNGQGFHEWSLYSGAAE
jgi:hypothetical protein